ncbi:UNVERIFIED_CONTAM: hypothetical protein FKN15_006684 [Acipenser sinensis]
MQSPECKKGLSPKLKIQWEGLYEVLLLSEVVYQVRLQTQGQKVVLQRNRLAPYQQGVYQGATQTSPAGWGPIAEAAHQDTELAPIPPRDCPCQAPQSLQDSFLREGSEQDISLLGGGNIAILGRRMRRV